MAKMIVMAIVFLATVSGCRTPKSVSNDAETYRVYYEEGSRHAGWDPVSYIEVKRQKDAYVYEKGEKYPPMPPKGETKREVLQKRLLSRSEADRIEKALKENRYDTMRRRYIDDRVIDGSYRKLSVLKAGRTKEVVVINTEYAPFERIVRILKSL